LINPEEVRSRRSYNKYIVDYPTVFGSKYLKERLIVETSVYIRAYPSVRMHASSFIYEYLITNGFEEIVQQYELSGFELNVQSAERTLIDKIFALGDYYLSDKVAEHSRHMYDIFKLLDVVFLDDKLKNLVKDVAEERKQHAACLSAQDGVDIKILLQEILDNNIYKSDFETITTALLFESVTYDSVSAAIQKIVDSGILD